MEDFITLRVCQTISKIPKYLERVDTVERIDLTEITCWNGLLKSVGLFLD